MKNDEDEMDGYDEHPEDDEPEKVDEALFGSADFNFSFGEGKEIPSVVIVVAGLLMVSISAGILTYTEGFGVADEWNSKDWEKVDANVEVKLYWHSSGHRITDLPYTTWIWNYTVDDVLYDGEWTCYSDERHPECWQSSGYYRSSSHQIAYNPDNPSESDLHPGFTRQIFWGSIHWIGTVGFFFILGLLVLSTGLGKMLGISLPGIEKLEELTPTEEDEDYDIKDKLREKLKRDHPDDEENDDPAEPRESDFLP